MADKILGKLMSLSPPASSSATHPPIPYTYRGRRIYAQNSGAIFDALGSLGAGQSQNDRRPHLLQSGKYQHFSCSLGLSGVLGSLSMGLSLRREGQRGWVGGSGAKFLSAPVSGLVFLSAKHQHRLGLDYC